MKNLLVNCKRKYHENLTINYSSNHLVKSCLKSFLAFSNVFDQNTIRIFAFENTNPAFLNSTEPVYH